MEIKLKQQKKFLVLIEIHYDQKLPKHKIPKKLNKLNDK